MIFDFAIRTQYTVWETETVEIEADTQEEANNQMLEFFEDYNYFPTHVELDYDSLVEIPPTISGTKEIRNASGYLIWNNL